jgi:hypothetical protein
MKPNLVLEIWRNQPGKFFCISTKDGGDQWKDHFFAREDFGRVRQFLLDNEDKNIYFCPHGFNRRVRQKTEAVTPTLLYADLDFADPTEIKPKPTIAIQSSPGRFVGIWLLKDATIKDWESLNRRLTYHVEADKGGWDLTQVLRFPGTRNYKYQTEPRVRVLWDDGRKYSVKQLEHFLPPAQEDPDYNILSPVDVFGRYESKLPRWVRKELVAKSIVGRADRSEMLWKIECACIEAGMTVDEAFAVIKNSIWNKFRGRRGEDKQLRKELNRVVTHKFNERPIGRDKLRRGSDAEESLKDKPPESRFKVKSIAEIEFEELDFLWYPYLARREISILEGDPGLGKSYLSMIVAAMIASGDKIPSPTNKKVTAQGPVVYFDMENSASTVTKARLRDNGYGDLKNYYPIEEPFSIEDTDAIEEIYDILEEIQPVLVVFDTLNVYIGRADTHKGSDVAQAFSFFKKMANDFNCAVLVLRHLTKNSGTSAIYRGQGSISMTGAARIVMSMGVDPDDADTRAMAVTKINFASHPKTMTFTIEAHRNDRSKFVWGDFKDLSAQEILDAAAQSRSEKQQDHIQDAMELLEKHLNGEWVERAKIYRIGERRSISRKTINAAIAKMDIAEKGSGGSVQLKKVASETRH